jgi:RNA-directed DNA polymerase
VSKRYRITVIRYADDFVILCEDLDTLKQVIARAEPWLADMGLEIKASKTRLTHTLNTYEGNVGFDFLGFHVRQYPVGKYRTRTYRGQPGFKTLIQPSPKGIRRHSAETRDTTRQAVGAPQAALINQLNPKIRGWSHYYRASVAKRTFNQLDNQMHSKLARWAKRRHPHKTQAWCYHRYWRRPGTRTHFSDGTHSLLHYADTPIVRHVKVKGDKSPFDGDEVYWGERLGRDLSKPTRVTKLLKQQHGRCEQCGLRFTTMDAMEVHHRDHDHNNNRYTTLALLHLHCHDQLHGQSAHDKGLRTEEPDDAKVSRPVL